MQSTSAYAPMPGNGSLVVNGQIVGVPMGNQFFPSLAMAPFYRGNGQPPPTIPINYGASTGTNGMLNASSPTQGPVFIAVAALIVGILGLRYIHWRK